MQINGYRLPNIYLFSSRNNTKIKKISFIHNWVSHHDEDIYITLNKKEKKRGLFLVCVFYDKLLKFELRLAVSIE